MKPLATWSTRKVVLACVLWLVGPPVLAAVALVLAGLVLAAISRGEQIGFTVRLSDWSLAWFYVPPLLLIGAWLWAARGKRGSSATHAS